MKHLLNGVAIAAVLVIAAPAWAQAPTTAPAGAPKAAAPAKHKVVYTRRKSAGDQMTAQLNREELARIQSAAVAPPPPSGFMGQPSPTMGIPGAGQPSASGHAVQSEAPLPPGPAVHQVSPSAHGPGSTNP